MNNSMFVRNYGAGGQPSYMEEIATLPGSSSKPNGLTDEQKKELEELLMGQEQGYIDGSGWMGVLDQGLRGYMNRGK